LDSKKADLSDSVTVSFMKRNLARFKILTEMNIQLTVFWIVA